MDGHIGLCLVPAPSLSQVLDLEIECVPSSALFSYLEGGFSLKPRCRNGEDEGQYIATRIKQLVHTFAHDRSLFEDAEALGEIYMKALGALAFVAPRLNLTIETREARESFLEKTARKFDVKDEKGRPNALTLYFTSPNESLKEGRYKSSLALPEGDYLEAARDIALTPSEALIEQSSHTLERQVEKSTFKAYRQMQSQRTPNNEDKLNLLSCLVTAKMLAVEFGRLSFEEMLAFYQKVARKEGDYYFKVPGFVVREEGGEH